MKTKIDALSTIISDARRESATVTSYFRVLRATRLLELNGDERDYVMSALDYCRMDGTPYPWLQKQLDSKGDKLRKLPVPTELKA